MMSTPYREDDSKELVLRDMPDPPVHLESTRLQRIWAGVTPGELFVMCTSYVVVALPMFFWPGVSAAIYFCFFALFMGRSFLDSLESSGRHHLNLLYEYKLHDWNEEVGEWQEERIEQIKSAGYEVFTSYEIVKLEGRFYHDDEIEFEVPMPK